MNILHNFFAVFVRFQQWALSIFNGFYQLHHFILLSPVWPTSKVFFVHVYDKYAVAANKKQYGEHRIFRVLNFHQQLAQLCYWAAAFSTASHFIFLFSRRLLNSQDLFIETSVCILHTCRSCSRRFCASFCPTWVLCPR